MRLGARAELAGHPLALGVGALVMWQAACALHAVPEAAVPSPLAVLGSLWRDRSLYALNVPATLLPAALGFVIGNGIAIGLAILFVLSPASELLLRGVSIAVFAIPPLALSPLLVVTLHGAAPQIVLAAVCVYFPTLVATSVGLRHADPRAGELVRLYGGGDFAILRWLRLPGCLPALLAGLRMAAPAAILGAILAEFGSGAPGLGSFLLSTMSLGDPARLWAIGLAATGLSAGVYGLVSAVASRSRGGLMPVTMPLSHGTTAASRAVGHMRHAALTVLAVAVPFALWQALPWLFGISPVIAKTPVGVFRYLFAEPDSADTRATLMEAFGQSLPLAFAGLLCGLVTALALALIACMRPSLSRLLMPGALLLQSMPLVALTPLIVLMFGRGVLATLVIATSVTFFPAFVTILEGMRLAPRAAFDVLRIYGAGAWQMQRFVTIPAALPYLCAAARLVAPGALLGVLTAEWLATGYGIGNLLNEARGTLDYGMIWTVAFATVAISVGFYLAVQRLEAFVLKRQEQ